MADRVYTKEETDAILARAIELEGHAHTTSHTELVAAAREIGVTPEALERAAAEVLQGRRDDEAMQALRKRRWRGFLAHLVPYVCVGVLLGFLNAMTGGFPWALIPMLAWGIGLASHLLAVAMPDETKLRRRIERDRDRALRREERAGRVFARVEPRAGRVRVPAGDEVGAARDEGGLDDADREEAARDEAAHDEAGDGKAGGGARSRR
jgi:hypothetical protein